MATGPEHYLLAQSSLLTALIDGIPAQDVTKLQLDGIGHAILALAAAAALGTHSGMDYRDHEAWDKVAGVQEDEEDDDPYGGLTNADVLTADELYDDERMLEAHLDAIDEERYAEEQAATRYDLEQYDVDDEDQDGGEDE